MPDGAASKQESGTETMSGACITNMLQLRAMALQPDLVSAPAHCPDIHQPKLTMSWHQTWRKLGLESFHLFHPTLISISATQRPHSRSKHALLLLHSAEELLLNKNIGITAKGSSLEWALEWECSTLNPQPSYLWCPKVRPCFGCVKAIPTNH